MSDFRTKPGPKKAVDGGSAHVENAIVRGVDFARARKTSAEIGFYAHPSGDPGRILLRLDEVIEEKIRRRLH